MTDQHKTTEEAPRWLDSPITWGDLLVMIGVYGFLDLAAAFLRAWL